MAEFRSVLKNYKPSPAAQQILKDTKLVLLTAPTAGGRNTIIDRLVETGRYHQVVSDTTRKMRTNNGVPEKDGREYWFRTEEAVLEDLKQGRFFEAQIIHNQQVSGISMREVEQARDRHQIAINEVDTLGISNVLPIKSDTIGLLIIPPNFKTWMRRLESRGQMELVERRRRFESAAEIYAMAMNGTYPTVVNDRLEDAVSYVDEIAETGRVDQAKQAAARKLAEELYIATRDHLDKDQ